MKPPINDEQVIRMPVEVVKGIFVLRGCFCPADWAYALEFGYLIKRTEEFIFPTSSSSGAYTIKIAYFRAPFYRCYPVWYYPVEDPINMNGNSAETYFENQCIEIAYARAYDMEHLYRMKFGSS